MAQTTTPAAPIFPEHAKVSDQEMQRVYDQARTPFKHGVILQPPEGKRYDCPSVFRHDGRWYMLVVQFDEVGYETLLARSDDLLKWEVLGAVLKGRQGLWDAMQAAGGVALQDVNWGGTYELEQHDGKYWMTYLGGALAGYETDPLSIGVAHTTAPDRAEIWHRPTTRPALSRDDADVRWFENITQYKSNVIRDPDKTLGHPFVMYYNGKARDAERIGMAVSDDMLNWKRFGDQPIIDHGRKTISGDPQIVKMGDLWVMFFFGAFYKPAAFDTFAVSKDLVHWREWEGPLLVAPSEPWDKTFAHKPWIVKHEGVVYHFYCAVGDRGRVLALATSKDLRAGN